MNTGDSYHPHPLDVTLSFFRSPISFFTSLGKRGDGGSVCRLVFFSPAAHVGVPHEIVTLLLVAATTSHDQVSKQRFPLLNTDRPWTGSRGVH
jgi:hypothetical protein